MQVIDLDGGGWLSELDFYNALARALGSVEWHGRNANAFEETMIYYLELNETQPPYEIVIRNANEPLLPFLREFASRIGRARGDRKDDPNWGDDVDVRVSIT